MGYWGTVDVTEVFWVTLKHCGLVRCHGLQKSYCDVGYTLQNCYAVEYMQCYVMGCTDVLRVVEALLCHGLCKSTLLCYGLPALLSYGLDIGTILLWITNVL